MKIIKIEIQHFEGCPNGPKMIKNCKEAISGIEASVDYKEILVEDEETARNVAFRGSPTLLIEGEDFEGLPVPDDPALSCRYYKDGVPSPEKIREKVLELL